ncbi:hypothetical protein AVEN_161070-1 [Araneus ventricosus]|uniref:Uncharacterized protein n=1 Tax=Araneus ventricosus TaxID=182803 RepID=A0A4Y2DXI9_ARAVE|nr:hypothetical protein AVEN_161070-1 [Araneus ventricosus]
MNKYSTDIRVFIVLEMAKCQGNVKAVQQAGQEEFHNKSCPDKRSSRSNHWVVLPIALPRRYRIAALFPGFKPLRFLLERLLKEKSVADKSLRLFLN